MERTERDYCNTKLIQRINAALTILFDNKKPVMKIADPYIIKIKLEEDKIEIDVSETKRDQNQAASNVEKIVNTTNNALSPSPATIDEIESETTPISDLEPPTVILNSEGTSFFISFLAPLSGAKKAADGVGYSNGDFWIGFDKLYTLMGDQRHVLNIVHKMSNGSLRNSTYDDFRLGWDGRGIRSLGKYFGNTGDYLREYENEPPKKPLWFVNACTSWNLDLHSGAFVVSSVMRIKPWPARF